MLNCNYLQARTSWRCTWMKIPRKFHGMRFDISLLRPWEGNKKSAFGENDSKVKHGKTFKDIKDA